MGKPLLVVSSVTYAMKSRDLLSARGFRAYVERIPRTRETGCGYGVYVPQGADEAETHLKGERGPHFGQDGTGGETMIYLDNSATTYPKPPQVRQAVARALGELGANPGRGGYPMSQRTAQAVYRCRSLAAEFSARQGRSASSSSPAAPRP